MVEMSSELPSLFALIDGLRLQPDRDGGLLEDTKANRFFRLGAAEWLFVEHLLATSSASEAWQLCEDSQQESLSTKAAERLCRWLIANKLVRSEADNPTGQTAPTSFLAQIFFLKVPVVDPDVWLTKIVRYVGWLFSPYAALLSLAVFFLGILVVAGRWDEFLYSYKNVFTPWRGLSLFVAWCVLKVLHELGHAGTCRRYGGEIKEAGLAFILMVPMAYVNATSSWRFRSRWQRLHVTLAGVIVELGVAGVALLACSCSSSLVGQQIAADVFLLAAVNSLLFNLNPLLRFDGYFALADATGVDNLYSHGQQYARYFGGRYLLGLDIPKPNSSHSNVTWIKFYGCAAAVYRAFTVSGLLVAAAAMLQGAGVAIALAGGIAFIIKPLGVLYKHLAQLYSAGRLSIWRLVARVGALSGCAIAPLWLIPAGLCWTVPAIVQYDPPAVLRASSDGFVDTIHVLDGARVVQGQPVVTLRNDELVVELWRRKTELARAEHQLLTAQWLGQSSETKQAQSRRDSLVEQVQQLQQDVDELTIVSPVHGTVLARDLVKLQGTYLESGAEIAVVGREESKRLKVSIAQSDARELEAEHSQVARVIVGNTAWPAKIDRIETRADTIPIDDSLLAVNGGSLPSIEAESNSLRLVTPRVSAFIRLAPERSLTLHAGRRVSVALSAGYETLGSQLLGTILKWAQL
ncbi:MAG: efflux RND transporter periplasmic adaptor subunit [Aureliella sp.]